MRKHQCPVRMLAPLCSDSGGREEGQAVSPRGGPSRKVGGVAPGADQGQEGERARQLPPEVGLLEVPKVRRGKRTARGKAPWQTPA